MEDMDTDILYNTASVLIKDPQGMEQLVASAGNTENPATGVAMYLMMLIESVSELLTSAGIDVAPDTWLAPGGAVDQLMPMIEDVLTGEGMQVGPSFGDEVTSAVLERAKGIVQAEQGGQAVESAPASPTADSAGLLGSL
jgi:hypothetical protein